MGVILTWSCIWVFHYDTLRTQRRTTVEIASYCRCRNYKWQPKILGRQPQNSGSHPIPVLRPFFIWLIFMMGLDKPRMHTKFKLARFTRCRYNARHRAQPHIFRRSELQSSNPRPNCIPELVSLSLFITEIWDQPKWGCPYFCTNWLHWISNYHISYAM